MQAIRPHRQEPPQARLSSNGTSIPALEAANSVREAIASVLRRDLFDVSDDARLFDDLAFDSSSIIELLVAIEDRIGVVIDPDELSECVFHTVGTITGFVTKNLA